MTSTTSQPEVGSDDEILWWHPLVNPTKMFPHLPPSIAVIMYCCVIVGSVILMLFAMWLCSSCLARRSKKQGSKTKQRSLNGSKKSNSIWSTPASGKLNGNTNDAFEMQERSIGTEEKKFDSLKHLETMPWWDCMPNTPSINWCDYYQKAQGKNRAKHCGRKGYPWKPQGGFDQEHKRKRSSRIQKENHPRTSEVDTGWEHVHPRNVDVSHYWYPSKPLDTRFFPRFRMIPRASWSNEHLLGCFGPNCYSDDYGNHSMASLTSTDMQIMQMIARRDGFIRPTRGDVFYGNCLDSIVPGRNCRRICMKPATSQSSPYDKHNETVSRRQTFRTFSADNARKSHSITSTPLPKPPISSDAMSTHERGIDDIPPPPPMPPGYPPPPTPLRSQSTSEHY